MCESLYVDHCELGNWCNGLSSAIFTGIQDTRAENIKEKH